MSKVKQVLKATRSWLLLPWYQYVAFRVGLRWNQTWKWYGRPLITQMKRGSITVGSNWIACSIPERNSIGVIQPVIMRAKTPDATISIGDRVGMSGCSVVARQQITIGNDVLIGSGVLIMDNDAHPVDVALRHDSSKIKSRPVVIGDSVFIGARTIITKGVEIGEGAVVGAGSVVSQSVEPYAIVAGNPARVIGSNKS